MTTFDKLMKLKIDDALEENKSIIDDIPEWDDKWENLSYAQTEKIIEAGLKLFAGLPEFEKRSAIYSLGCLADSLNYDGTTSDEKAQRKFDKELMDKILEASTKRR